MSDDQLIDKRLIALGELNKILITKGSEFISWKLIKESFPEESSHTFEDGKTVQCLEWGVNYEGFEYITLDCFMPKGTFYAKNHHDFFEWIYPIQGEGEDTIIPYTLKGAKPQRIPVNTPHTILAKTDFRFISQCINKNNL